MTYYFTGAHSICNIFLYYLLTLLNIATNIKLDQLLIFMMIIIMASCNAHDISHILFNLINL